MGRKVSADGGATRTQMHARFDEVILAIKGETSRPEHEEERKFWEEMKSTEALEDAEAPALEDAEAARLVNSSAAVIANIVLNDKDVDVYLGIVVA